ncbi:MAG TPA: YgiT-type zinc finger protein [Candidatus Binatia bacterium]|nr:YgiT-type zinc finger protein [Candidatus Binatia bacterium]
MKCAVCSGLMKPVTTSLPFKLSDERIIILKGIPVLQCGSCAESLLEDAVMARADAMLGKLDGGAELAVIRYAAGEGPTRRLQRTASNGGCARG